MRYEITEVCSNCENEVTMLWNTDADGFKAFCPFCGEELLLCDECQSCDDANGCDWCKERGCWRKRQFEEKNLEKRLAALEYDFTYFSEKTYNRVKYAYDLLPVDDLIGKVYCGEVCIELMLEPDGEDNRGIGYNVYYPCPNSDYGFSNDVGNYDFCDGGFLGHVSDFEEVSYEKFEEMFKREISNLLKNEFYRELLLSCAEKPVVRW